MSVDFGRWKFGISPWVARKVNPGVMKMSVSPRNAAISPSRDDNFGLDLAVKRYPFQIILIGLRQNRRGAAQSGCDHERRSAAHFPFGFDSGSISFRTHNKKPGGKGPHGQLNRRSKRILFAPLQSLRGATSDPRRSVSWLAGLRLWLSPSQACCSVAAPPNEARETDTHRLQLQGQLRIRSSDGAHRIPVTRACPSG